MKKLFLIVIAIAFAISLVSCRALFPEREYTPETPDTGGGTEIIPPSDEQPQEKKMLELSSGNTASFRFVTTGGVGSSTIRNVDKTVSAIRELGFEIEDRAADQRADQVRECEIIVGLDARFRGDECSVSSLDIGNRGYIIKVVDKRVIIAGGTPELTNYAFELFKTEYLGIGEGSEDVTSFSIPEDLFIFQPTEYKVDSVSIAGNDLSLYSLYIDDTEKYLDESIPLRDIQIELFDKTGYYIEIGEAKDLTDDSYAIILRYTEDAGEDGFRMYIEGNRWIFESEYKNALYDEFYNYMKANVFDVGFDVNIPADTNISKNVREVYYSDFGAVGDGRTDDYDAIYAAHNYANRGGQTVYADDNAVYYLNSTPYPIVIKTSVEFGNAKFIIDDRGDTVFAQKGQGLFKVVRDIGYSVVSGEDIPINTEDTTSPIISHETDSLPWLVKYLTVDSMVRIFDATHYDYVRYGANQNSGTIRQDVILVSADGTIDPSTPPAYEFYNINNIHVFRCDDRPITINGGVFETIACRTVAATDFINKWAGYYRGFTISRSNVTVTNMKHTVTGEPDATPSNNNFIPRKESYPYYGFLFITECYNVLVKDTELVGRRRYWEDKPSTTTSPTTNPSQPVPMGSYDFVIEHSSHTVFDNVQQTNSITDQNYWGIMSSNGSKNMSFIGCAISRYDAHRSFFNGTLIDTRVGFTFNVIGGGTLYAKNCIRETGNSFIYLRSDYGATFNGDIILEDCELEGYKTHSGGSKPTSKYDSSYVVNSGFSTASGYLSWDFGYTCYMPRSITLINYKAPGKNYVYTNINDKAFNEDYSNAYVITEEIILKNTSLAAICPSSNCKKLRAIKTTVID